MSPMSRAGEGPRGTEGARMPCETPGCSVNCSSAYDCHEARMGRSRLLPWPIVAIGIVILVAIVF